MKFAKRFLVSKDESNLIRSFYFLGLVILQSQSTTIISQFNVAESPTWHWPLAWYDKRLSLDGLYFLLLSIAAIYTINIFTARFWLFRALGALAWMMNICLLFPNGQVGNANLTWPVVALIFSWPAESVGRSDRKLLVAAQAFTFSTYFSAGLWKLRTLLASLETDLPWTRLSQSLVYAMGHERFAGGDQGSIFFNVFYQNPTFSAGVWIITIFFQLSTFLGVTYPRTKLPFAVGLVFFHLLVTILIGPNFASMALAVAFICFIGPFLIKKNGDGSVSLSTQRRVGIAVFAASALVSQIVLPSMKREFLLPFSNWKLFAMPDPGIPIFDLLVELNGRSFLLSKSEWTSDDFRLACKKAAYEMGKSQSEPENFEQWKSQIEKQLSQVGIKLKALVAIDLFSQATPRPIDDEKNLPFKVIRKF